MTRTFQEMVQVVGFLPAVLCVIDNGDKDRLTEVSEKDWVNVYLMLLERDKRMMHTFLDMVPDRLHEISEGKEVEAFEAGYLLLKEAQTDIKVGTFWKFFQILVALGGPGHFHEIATLFTPEICKRVGARKSEAFLNGLGKAWALAVREKKGDQSEFVSAVLLERSPDHEDDSSFTDLPCLVPDAFAASALYQLTFQCFKEKAKNGEMVCSLDFLCMLYNVMHARDFHLSVDEERLPSVLEAVYQHKDLSPEVMVWLGARLSDRHSLSAAVLDRYALHVFEAGSSERLCGFLVYPSLFEFKYEQGEIPRDDSIKSAELRRRVQALRETTYQHLLLKTKTIREYMAFVTALRAAQKATHVGDWKQREEEMVEQLLRKRVTDVQELIEMYVFVRSDEQAAERVRKRILKHESVQLSSMEVLIESARNEVLFPKLTFKLRLMAEVQPGEMLLHPDGDDALVMSLLRVARKQKSRASTWRRWCREMEKLWQEEEGRALLMSRVFRLALEAADTDQKCVQLYDACPVWFEMLQDDTTKQSETALFKLQLADQELYLEKVFGLTDTVEEAENCYSHLSWHSGALRKKMEKEMVRRAKALLEEVD